MTITPEQLAYAAKALGIDAESLEDKWSNGEKFAEWAVPVLEERHDIDIDIWLDCMTKEESGYDHTWTVRTNHCPDVTIHGPDIDTAVFLLAAKIGEGME